MIFNIFRPLQAEEILPLITCEWAPYSSEKIEGGGIIVEIVTAVVKEMGMTPKIRFYPWLRGESYVRKGKYFATFPYAKTKERIKIYDYSENIFDTYTVFFYYKPKMKKINYKTFDELKSLKIGGRRGEFYIPWFKKAGLNVQVVDSYKQLIQLLQRGRIELAPIDRITGWIIIQKLFPEQLHQFGTLKKPIERTPEEIGTHLLISKTYPNHRKLTIRFNKALIKIKKNGVYEKIIKKYDFLNIKN